MNKKYINENLFDPADFSSNTLLTKEDEELIKKFYKENELMSSFSYKAPLINEDPWIQTYSGRKFNPLNPVGDAIVIQDISHALSMQCRFSGHTNEFYSVAQHCVGVSYICDAQDALWGLLHDAAEAYLVDIPRPLKHSGKMAEYIEFENKMQYAICERFGLPITEPESVKKADKIMLATEARDLMSPLHKEWRNLEEPLPFKIVPLSHREAKDLFMKRFFELSGSPASFYEHYLSYENKK